MSKQFFIFRNFTVEPIFHGIDECDYSGYDDISFSGDYDYYVWFYQYPLNQGLNTTDNEIHFYLKKLNYIINRIESTETILCFTMTLYKAITGSSERKMQAAVETYNNALYRLSEQYKNIKIINYATFVKSFRLSDLIDYRHYYMSQVLPNPKLSLEFTSWFTKEIKAIEGIRKKCLIVDLDNTLWGGVLGEDEISGIMLGNAYPGNCYSEMQSNIKKIKEDGVILAICSKNNPDDVAEVFDKHEGMILNLSDFAVVKANWANKVTNIQDIANELNIGMDSMVFIDDSPFEREQVLTILPDVVVPDFPNHQYEIPMFIDKIYNEYFRIYELTDEDRNRTDQYLSNKERDSFLSTSISFNDLIAEMNIQLTISRDHVQHIPRISQMTQKTNQFNLTTQRYTETEIKKMIIEENFLVYDGSVTDKFGDNGITALAIVEIKDSLAEIETLLLSCRILGRTIEFTFLNHILLNIFDQHNVTSVRAIYKPTKRNAQILEFMAKTQFSLTDNMVNNDRVYILNKRNFIMPDSVIDVNLNTEY